MGALSDFDGGGSLSSSKANHPGLVENFYDDPLEVNPYVYSPNAPNQSPVSDMDYVEGDNDPEAKEATAHAISLTRAYQNLGAILATEAECQTSFSIKSLGAVIGKVHTEFCNFFTSLYDNLFSCGSLTTMVHRDSRMKASDTSQCSWVDLEFQEMTYIFQVNASIENSFVEVGYSSN